MVNPKIRFDYRVMSQNFARVRMGGRTRCDRPVGPRCVANRNGELPGILARQDQQIGEAWAGRLARSLLSSKPWFVKLPQRIRERPTWEGGSIDGNQAA